MAEIEICNHRNGMYGRCVLPGGHGPIPAIGGMEYPHMYKLTRATLGNLDNRELVPQSGYAAKHRKDE